MSAAVRHAASVLRRPDGRLLVRDYAEGDMAEGRLEAKALRKLGDHFYVRGDGTRAYYFSAEKLVDLVTRAGEEAGGAGSESEGGRYAAATSCGGGGLHLECLSVEVQARQRENRGRGLLMPRRWIQAVFGWGPGVYSPEQRHAADLA